MKLIGLCIYIIRLQNLYYLGLYDLSRNYGRAVFLFLAVVASRSVNQRPSYESDAYLECRLTAPIIPEPDGTKTKERYDLWYEGNRK